MKKLLTGLAGGLASFGLMAGVVAAQSANVSGPTGPNSNNQAQVNNNTTTTINCVNSAGVVTTTLQSSSSGQSNVNNTTSAGNVSSGSANNTSSTNTDVNMGCPAATRPVAANPPAGGQGGGSGSQGGQPAVAGTAIQAAPAPRNQAASNAGVAALPATGTSDVVKPAAIAAIGLATVVGLSQAAVRVFGRRSL